ncbi:MAG: glycoside hydrolase 100 family protein [Candidatus Nanopelagicales bacterium]
MLESGIGACGGRSGPELTVARDPGSGDSGISIAAMTVAATDVLKHNARGPHAGLPRTAGWWGYPQPYTRDLMVAGLGMVRSGDPELPRAHRAVLTALAGIQTQRGHICGIAHDPSVLGATDTTPLFLIGLADHRLQCGEPELLSTAASRALTWLDYQSPDESGLIGQLPTTDWRDEHWVLGHGLYVNVLNYLAPSLWNQRGKAERLRALITRSVALQSAPQRGHEGLGVPHVPYLAMWSFKIYHNDRMDLLGNSLAILAGVVDRPQAEQIIDWIEATCQKLRQTGELAGSLPPVLLPFIQPTDPDWRDRYALFNRPGEYHNGGIWPFVVGFYIAALVAVGRLTLAQQRLSELGMLLTKTAQNGHSPGFNEWACARNALPNGQDWQTWSAGMFLYGAQCVATDPTPLFDSVREW